MHRNYISIYLLLRIPVVSKLLAILKAIFWLFLFKIIKIEGVEGLKRKTWSIREISSFDEPWITIFDDGSCKAWKMLMII